MIQSFLDESGTNPEVPALSVAGCFGEEDQWKIFRDLWGPHSQGFHASHSTRMFPQITEAMRVAGIRAIVLWVAKDMYKESSSAHFKTSLGNAYSCCALLCATSICEVIKPRKTAFVLEAGQPNLGMVKSILESMMDAEEENNWCVGSVASATKADFIELHTADFVSHIFSSKDAPWINRLLELDILGHAEVTQQNIEETAPKVTALMQVAKAMRRAHKNGTTRELDKFNESVAVILRADPGSVKAAVDATIRKHTAERIAKGEHKRGRKPKPSDVSVSDPASDGRD